ncbi:MAG TPA: HD domain-containing protein [Mycobacteriales bacterium]
MTAVPDEPANEGEASLAGHLRSAMELLQELAGIHDMGKVAPEFRQTYEGARASSRSGGNVRGLGPSRKISISMPEDLTMAVRQRVGRGELSQYVTEAVSRQLELDLLNELAALLEAEHGPVPEEYLTEARAAWPDAD